MRPLNGYPTSFGNKRATVFPHAGPSSYVVFTDTPAAGGDPVTSRPEAGAKFFDFLIGGVSDSGTYFVRACPAAANPSDGPNGSAGPTYTLIWYVMSTGLQVDPDTDLSDEIVRLYSLGPV